MVKTKIVCTLGPSSNTRTVLRKMILAGMDFARFNFSHSVHKEHLDRISLVREINKKYRRHIRLLGDLEGYRIRVSSFNNGKPLLLKKRQVIWLTKEHKERASNVVPFDYAGSLKDIKIGQVVFIDDGNISLIVKGYSENALRAEVVKASERAARWASPSTTSASWPETSATGSAPEPRSGRRLPGIATASTAGRAEPSSRRWTGASSTPPDAPGSAGLLVQLPSFRS